MEETKFTVLETISRDFSPLGFQGAISSLVVPLMMTAVYGQVSSKLLNEFGLLISEGFIEEIQLTRTKYLMKRTKEMSDFEMKSLEKMKKSQWF